MDIASLIMLVAITILIISALLLGSSIQDAITEVQSGGVHIPLPPETISTWPLLGRPLHSLWMSAATDFPNRVQKYIREIKDVSLQLLTKLAGIGMGFLVFICALIIASIFMA